MNWVETVNSVISVTSVWRDECLSTLSAFPGRCTATNYSVDLAWLFVSLITLNR